jgi:DNA-binding response OmpR family regulator
MDKKRILIAEDDVDILHVMKIILKSAGYEVEATPHGREVIEAERERPHLVILDKGMPDMDGVEVCKELRRQPETKDVPVIMISAYPNLRSAAAEAGANDILKKPFGMHTLLKMVNTYTSAQEVVAQKVENKKICVIEGNRDILFSLENILSSDGYKVEAHRTGKAILEKDHEPADLYIIDSKLPDMDGLNVCRHLRKNSVTKSKPIIIMTALNINKAQAMEAGADFFVEKPFSLTFMLKEIERIFR